MPFNSSVFWLGVTLLFLAAFLLKRRCRLMTTLLLLASYCVYWKLGGGFLLILLVLTLMNYVIARRMLLSSPQGKRAWLWLGIAADIALLVASRQATLITWIAHSPLLDWPTRHLFVPIGMSFVLFQAMSYLFDVSRGKWGATESLPEFALYLAFFPKIVAGPIERPQAFLPQLRSPVERRPGRYGEAFSLIAWGLFEKFVIAENARLIADRGFSNPDGLGFFLVLAALAFTLQIYADFSGYSDLAKGVAGLFDIELSWNFQQPYFATSPGDFWRRWHISLSQWFRDYVYIPLGGSRAGLPRTILHLLITMLLVGWWHGRGSTFLLWGLYFGILQSIEHLHRALRTPREKREPSRLSLLTRIVIYLPFTVFGWILFRSDSFGKFVLFLQNLNFTVTDSVTHWLLLLLWAPILLMDIAQFRSNDRFVFAHAPPGIRILLTTLILCALMLFVPASLSNFIYARF